MSDKALADDGIPDEASDEAMVVVDAIEEAIGKPGALSFHRKRARLAASASRLTRRVILGQTEGRAMSDRAGERPSSTFAGARCLTAAEAARYCSLTPSGFRQWVARGTLPDPLPGTRRWDKRAIDAALDRHSGIMNDNQAAENDLDLWLSKHGQG